MTRFTTTLPGLLYGLCLAHACFAAGVEIYVTNAAGDRVHVIDAATNKVVREIKGIEIPSGVDFSHDKKIIYVSCEGEKTLDFVDRASGKIVGKTPLTGRPNSISTSPDGKFVFVAIAQAPGGVDVVETASMKRVKTIPIKGAVHYAYLTPDGKYIAASSIAGRIITIIDIGNPGTALGLQIQGRCAACSVRKRPGWAYQPDVRTTQQPARFRSRRFQDSRIRHDCSPPGGTDQSRGYAK